MELRAIKNCPKISYKFTFLIKKVLEFLLMLASIFVKNIISPILHISNSCTFRFQPNLSIFIQKEEKVRRKKIIGTTSLTFVP